MNKNLHLNEEQFKRILKKIRDRVNEPDFKLQVEDSTTIGEKYTTSNCGLCNNDMGIV